MIKLAKNKNKSCQIMQMNIILINNIHNRQLIIWDGNGKNLNKDLKIKILKLKIKILKIRKINLNSTIEFFFIITKYKNFIILENKHQLIDNK